MEGGPALQDLQQQAEWASFHIARLEAALHRQQRVVETLERRLRVLEAEALEAVSDLYFRLDNLAAVVNQLLLRTRALQLQLDFLGGLPDNTDSASFSFYTLD